MNIVFVNLDANSSSLYFSTWRGYYLFAALKKNGLHNVSMCSSTEFQANTKISQSLCEKSQLIIIEGSPEIDLLKTITFWKSHGKKVVVDIPLRTEVYCNNLNDIVDKSFSISQIYSDFQNKNLSTVNDFERFRWGLHLADSIFVSSQQQKDKWQITAPVRVIPEYIDLDSIRDLAKYQHKEFIIGIFSNQQLDNDIILQKLILNISHKIPNAKWVSLCSNQLPSNISSFFTFPSDLSTSWPAPLSVIDLAIFWDTQKIRGEYYRNILETMSLKIPWIINEQKGYRDIRKYGLIVEESLNKEVIINSFLQDLIKKNSSLDDGYFHAIGQNIDDHLHEVVSVFSNILKSTSQG